MSNLISLNILVLYPFELIVVRTDPELTPDETKKVLASDLGCPISSFSLFISPTGISLPNEVDTESIRSVLPANIAPRKVPRTWDAGALFSATDDLHLIVVHCKECISVNVYDTRQDVIIKYAQLTLIDEIEKLLSHQDSGSTTQIYKSPPGIACGTVQEHKNAIRTLGSLALDSLPEIRKNRSLVDEYSWGLPEGEVHFIIDPPAESNFGDELRELLIMPNLASKRTDYFRATPRQPPSSGGKTAPPPNVALIGRPDESILPPSLLDETLCNLRNDITYKKPTKKDMLDYHRLRTEMMNIFKSEAARMQALTAVLGNILPADPKPGTIGSYKDDGHLSFMDGKTTFLYYLQEVKNEISGNSAEPNFEVARYYIEHCRQCHNAGVGQHCNLPAVLLCQTGPYLMVSIAVFTNKPIIEQIVCIPLHVHITNTAQIEAGARVVAALRKACNELHRRYPTLVMDTERQAEFPFPRSFGLHRHNFTYTAALKDKKVYRARVNESGTAVYIKYTTQYSKQAHDFASDNGFAPRLLHFEPIGNWFMVVMEDVSDDYASLDVMKYDEMDVTGIPDKVKDALCLLHEGGYVHGDVRDVNVLVRKIGNEAVKSILIVDWDWAGLTGEAAYPHDLNLNVNRPDGAEPGGGIQEIHDTEMADMLLGI